MRVPYNNTKFKPAGPSVFIRITDKRRGRTFPEYEALVDSGASYSGIAKSIIDRLSKHKDYDYDSNIPAKFPDGSIKPCEAVKLIKAKIEFLDNKGALLGYKEYNNLTLLILPDGHVGRDILNAQTCELDGPHLELDLK